jgi:hypothetical protein
MGEPEDRRTGPMVNGDPWPPRVSWIMDDFDGTRNRYVGHGRAKILQPTAAGH